MEKYYKGFSIVYLKTDKLYYAYLPKANSYKYTLYINNVNTELLTLMESSKLGNHSINFKDADTMYSIIDQIIEEQPERFI